MATTVCVACNNTNSGMINIYAHPNNLDGMFISVSSIAEVNVNDSLCIPCYDDLKIAYSFKKKCLQSELLRQKAEKLCDKVKKTDEDTFKLPEENPTHCDSVVAENIIVIKSEESLHKHVSITTSYTNSPINCFVKKDVTEEINVQQVGESFPEESVNTDYDNNVCDDTITTNLFNCLICGKSFTRYGNFRRHQKTIHMIGHKLSSKVGRNKHKRGPSPKLSKNDIFASLKDTQCEYCFLDFENEDLMKTHELNHKSEEKPYKCSHESCTSHFKERFGLRKHLETHSDIKRFKCKFCDQRFHQIGNARSHERYHTGEKPYLCPHCGKAFAESGNLKAHIRFHTGERPYACPQCPKRFTTHYSHKIHIRSHTQERPYLCSDCGKSFKSSGKLLVHKRIHSGYRPYICDVCPAAFVDSSGLKRHSRIH